MAKILFRLRGVPDEEADEVRNLLDQQAIDWYETSAGKFLISFPAIWLRDESQEARARSILNDYQQQRVERVRAEYAALESRGERETLLQRFVSKPGPVLLALLAVSFILYISIKPFLALGLVRPE